MALTALLVLDRLSSNGREDDFHDGGGYGDCGLYHHSHGHDYV